MSNPPPSIPLIFTPDALTAATLPIYPGLGRAQKYAGLHTPYIVDKCIELVCSVRVTTEDSCFVLDVGPDLPKERETSPWRWGLDIENLSNVCVHSDSCTKCVDG